MNVQCISERMNGPDVIHASLPGRVENALSLPPVPIPHVSSAKGLQQFVT